MGAADIFRVSDVRLDHETRLALAAVGLLALAKLALGGAWPLLADEAYHWVWSREPAFGYYDQPPMVAWMIRATTVLGDGGSWVRLGAVACGLIAPLALLPHAGDGPRWLLWWAGLPPLLWLTWFATPDAPLLLFWSLTLAAALGGRWALAGLAGGLAFLSKYSGGAVLALCLLALPEDRARWRAVPVALAVALPNLAWNAGHGFVSFAFQLEEGLLHPHAPGLTGPLVQIADQILVVTPVAFAAGLVWMVRGLVRPLRLGRVERVAWATSAPVLVFFALAAVGGPPEAHWAAPAWIGVGLGLSHVRGRLGRVAEFGAWLGLLGSMVLAVHAFRPVLSLVDDPAVRLWEGPALASWVVAWHEAEDAAPVLTERYQEAALVHYHTGIPARKLAGCGRRDQYDLRPVDPPPRALLLRPARSGDALCSDALYPERSGRWLLRARDAADRPVGIWEIHRIARAP